MRVRPQEQLRSLGTLSRILEEAFPKVESPVSDYLLEHPALIEFLLRLEHKLKSGEITPSELNNLGQQWLEGLPRQRGATIFPLSAALQPELQLGQPRYQRVILRTRGRQRKRNI
jgi:hypothetical protein